nr:hypothetical protein [Tanacetum cinerariifolium]
WWKPLKEERPATPEPAWSIPSSDVPIPTNNWASALAHRFYIDRHTSEGDRSTVRIHMRILSVVRIEVFSMYGYDYMKKIVLRRADLNEHVIDKYEVHMMMHFNEIHKFSNGTLQQIDKALDYRVKEFRINRMNLGLNTRFWTRKDVDRSKAFMFAIQKRLKTRRIFRNLESFVGGRVRDGDYRLLKQPTWSIRSSDVPVPTYNWASALASNYSPPPEDSLLAQTDDIATFIDWFCKRRGITELKPQDLEGLAFEIVKTGDIATFMDWFCKRRGITELKPQDLEGPAFKIVKVFHPDVIHLQYQMEECHKLLTDSVDDSILRHNISKPLPLGGPPGQVTIQTDFFFNKDLE